MTEDKPITQETSSDSHNQKPVLQPGPISHWLNDQGLKHHLIEPDHIGIESIGVEPSSLYEIASALKADGFDYLQCQGGYDEGPGQRLVCFYHLIGLGELAQENGLVQASDKNKSNEFFAF